MKGIFFVLALCFLFSCQQKRNERSVIGCWKKIDVVNGNSSQSETWVFEESGESCLLLGSDTVTHGFYLVKRHIITVTSEANITFYTGDWEIQDIDDEIMILSTQNNGLVYMEFMKVQ